MPNKLCLLGFNFSFPSSGGLSSECSNLYCLYFDGYFHVFCPYVNGYSFTLVSKFRTGGGVYSAAPALTSFSQSDTFAHSKRVFDKSKHNNIMNNKSLFNLTDRSGIVSELDYVTINQVVVLFDAQVQSHVCILDFLACNTDVIQEINA